MASKKDQKQVTEPLQSAKQLHPAKSKDTSPLTPVTPNVRPKQSTSPPSNLLRLALLALPFAVTYIHVLLAPYTKVEETPALHAVHDIMKYGTSEENVSKFEHVLYPGAVPRSFIPSFAIAFVTKPLVVLGTSLGVLRTGLQVQILVRLVLATVFSSSLAHLTTTVWDSSPLAAVFFVLLSITQFHVPFYAGRTLPNFLALPLVIFAFSNLLRSTSTRLSPPSTPQSAKKKSPLNDMGEELSATIALLTITATVIRLEIAPMIGAISLVLIAQGRLTIRDVILAGAIGGFSGLVFEIIFDYLFYSATGHPLSWWPELSAFIFNIPQGRAAEWGVMPWYHYIISVGRLCMVGLPLALLQPIADRGEDGRRRTTLLVPPVLAILAALSCIGHKEWRFVVYVVPLLNVFAAFTAAKLWTTSSGLFRAFWRLAIIGGIALNLVVTIFLTFISARNYPGGEIGIKLESLVQDGGKVWIPAAALHSGATAFTLPPTHLDSVGGNMTIVRPESSYEASHSPSGNSPRELWEGNYDWVVTDDWESFMDTEKGGGVWAVADDVEGYKGVHIAKRWPFLTVNMGRRLAIMRRAE